MKIVRANIYRVPPDTSSDRWSSRKAYVFVRLETDEGVIGWGEAHSLAHRDKSLIELIRAMVERLIGWSAWQIKAFTTETYRVFAERRAGIDLFCALSAVEIALWDIVGKFLGVPVYRLLGGTCREVIPCYANLSSDRPRTAKELAAKASEMVQQGFRTLKIYPFLAGEDLDEGIRKIRCVRDAVGPAVGLAVDLWRQFLPSQAREIARAAAPFDLAWIEEPIPPENTTAMKDLHQRIQQPLMAGETLTTKRDFRPFLEIGALDYINPDVAACGGILEMREIAAMAEPYFIRLAPHNYNSMTIALAATIHAAAGMPNLLMAEYFPAQADDAQALGAAPMVPHKGYLALPQTPGLGVELDSTRMQTGC